MSQFHEVLKNIVQPGMITAAANMLNEKEENVSVGVSSIFAGLLEIMLKKSNTLQVWNILKEGGNLNILKDPELLFEEKPTKDQRKLGDDFLQELLGDKAARFTAAISRHAKLSKVATNSLIDMTAPVFVGYFGKKLVADGWSIQMIANEIKKQEEDFIQSVPDEIVYFFAVNDQKQVREDKEKRNGQLLWGILIFLFILFMFVWRSCRNQRDLVDDDQAAVSVHMPDRPDLAEKNIDDYFDSNS